MANAILSGLEKIGSGLATAEKFMAHMFADVQKIDQTLHEIAPELKTIGVKLLADVTAVIADTTAAVGASGLNVTIDASVVTAIQTLVSDARNGVTTAKSTLDSLGVKL